MKACLLLNFYSIVVVEKSVARKAQEMLRDKRLTLVYNLKLPVLKRIARCTQAEIVNSVDSMFGGKTRLGVAGSFRSESFQLINGRTKSVLFFEDCQPDLSCAVILQGPALEDLKRAKKIVKFVTVFPRIISCPQNNFPLELIL